MKRKLLTLGLGLLCITGLCGCGQEVVYVTQDEYNDIQKQEQIKQENKERFQPTGKEYLINKLTWKEYVATKTDNLYICLYYTYCHRGFAGMSPLYDENGNIAKYQK